MAVKPQEALQALQPWIKRQERRAWKPIVSDGDKGPADSKFSGLPVLLAGEKWPRCKCCQDPLELFVQLDLASLPAELGEQFGKGILQLFYCIGPDYCEPGWEAFSNQCSLCRIVPETSSQPASKNLNKFPPKSIIGWEPFIDLPDPMEHDELGLLTDYHFKDVPFKPTEVTCPELNLHFVGMDFAEAIEETIASADGEKLAGWPDWVQGPEYPACPVCGSKMQLVMQIDSEDNVPFMFGDCGRGHVTQCPVHKQVVAFAWACC